MGDNYNQIYTFILYSSIVGFALGVLYDVFRLIRMTVYMPLELMRELDKQKKHSDFFVNTVVFICDILYLLISAVICAIFIFHVNDGRIRGIALFGSLIGFILYYNTIGRLVTLIARGIIKSVYMTLRFIRHRLIVPVIRFAAGALLKLWKLICLAFNIISSRMRANRYIRKAGHGFE